MVACPPTTDYSWQAEREVAGSIPAAVIFALMDCFIVGQLVPSGSNPMFHIFASVPYSCTRLDKSGRCFTSYFDAPDAPPDQRKFDPGREHNNRGVSAPGEWTSYSPDSAFPAQDFSGYQCLALDVIQQQPIPPIREMIVILCRRTPCLACHQPDRRPSS